MFSGSLQVVSFHTYLEGLHGVKPDAVTIIQSEDLR